MILFILSAFCSINQTIPSEKKEGYNSDFDKDAKKKRESGGLKETAVSALENEGLKKQEPNLSNGKLRL